VSHPGSGVIFEIWALQPAVIPAKAGIYSAHLPESAVDGVDSRFRGNDRRFERDPIPKDTTTQTGVLVQFESVRVRVWVSANEPNLLHGNIYGMVNSETWAESKDQRRFVGVRLPSEVYSMLVDRAVKHGHTVQTEVMLAIYRYLLGDSQLPANAFSSRRRA
jgi:hypothetical protein